MSTQLKILVGLIFTLLTCIPLATIAMNDLGHDFGLVSKDQPTGMEQRAASLQGRQIEVGADLFGQYCYSCHGKRGEGLPGRLLRYEHHPELLRDYKRRGELARQAVERASSS